MKTAAFAAAVSRDDLTQGAAELGVDFDEHLTIVISALAERRDELLPARPEPSGDPAAEPQPSADPAAEPQPGAAPAAEPQPASSDGI